VLFKRSLHSGHIGVTAGINFVVLRGHLPRGSAQWAHGLLVPSAQPGEDAVHVKGVLALAHNGGAVLPRELAGGAA